MAVQEKCGIIALYNLKPTKQIAQALIAACGVQHRGQHGAGIAQRRSNKILRYVGNGLLKEVFPQKLVKKFDKKSLWTLIHCRYGTYGGYCEDNLQPCFATKEGSQIAVIHNGEFVATDQMRKKIRGKIIDEASDTSLFTRLLAQAEGSSWEEKVTTTLSQVKGSYSLVIGIDDQLFITRDPFGIRPLVIGKIQDGWIFASETHALDKLGVKVIREVKLGEIICINKNGMKTVVKGFCGPGNFCDFEWAYFSKPNSLLPTYEQNNDYKEPENWLSVAAFREKCGQILAKEIPITKASFVVGVPDSGVYLAMGYANSLKLPYRQVIIRDHFDPNGNQRLFMRDDAKETIGSKVLGKLSLVPDRKIWQDAIVVVGDDSIVRGNVTKQIARAIFNLGAKEVHLIIGFPPVIHRCFLGVSLRTEEELVAYEQKSDTERIAKEIGATSVHYISPKAFVQARLYNKNINFPNNFQELFLQNGGCGGCLTGLYPVNKKGEVYKPKKPEEETSFEKPICNKNQYEKIGRFDFKRRHRYESPSNY